MENAPSKRAFLVSFIPRYWKSARVHGSASAQYRLLWHDIQQRSTMLTVVTRGNAVESEMSASDRQTTENSCLSTEATHPIR